MASVKKVEAEQVVGDDWVGVRLMFLCTPPPILGHGARASIGTRSTVSDQPGDIRIEYSESRALFRVMSVSKKRTQYVPMANVAVFELEDVN